MAARARTISRSLALAWWISLFAAAPAGAEESYQGRWLAGATRISVSIQSWGEDCGPKPRSDFKPEGGIALITQRGHHLFIHGRGRAIRTDACWSPNRAMQRNSSSFLDNVWTVRCSTEPGDPKQEQGEYTLRAESPDRLLYRDVSRYDWKIKQSSCVAVIDTTQTLSRIEDELTGRPDNLVPPAPEEPAKPGPAEACRPGEPARIVIRPKRAATQPAQRVCFRTEVLDAADCPVSEPGVRWSLRHAEGLRAQLQDGCFRSAESAAEAEGEFEIWAEVGALRAQALVTVKPLDLSGLIARRIESGAVSGFEEESKHETVDAEPAEQSSRRKVQVQPGGGLDIGAAAAGALLAVLGLTGVIFWLRRRAEPMRPAEALDGGGQPISYQAASGAPAIDKASGQDGSETESAEQWICPTCRRGYPRKDRICPRDSTELVPYQRFAREQKTQQGSAGRKRCPRCGAVYPATVAFCNEDGTTLEPLD